MNLSTIDFRKGVFSMITNRSTRCSARPLAVVAVGLGVLSTSTLTGCNNAGEGALTGAGIGALAGMGLGSLGGKMGIGAAAGAIIGGVGGAIIGDQNARR